MPKLPVAQASWVLEEPDSIRLQQEYPSLWASPRKSCITCGFQAKADPSVRTFRWWDSERLQVVTWECDCYSQWIIHRYLLAHGIGKGYQRLGMLDAVHVPQGAIDETFGYLSEASWYVERGVNMIYHSKNPGTGKTLMLMLLAKGLLAQGVDAYVAQMNKILDMYTAGWRSPSEQAYFEQRIMNCAVLHIDDLGKEGGVAAGIDLVNRLIDRVIRHRTAQSLPTIITTNLEPEQLTSGYSEYVMSLLTETCTFVPVAGVDWRPQSRLRMKDEILQRMSRPLVMS